jgi:hypothetical protein
MRSYLKMDVYHTLHIKPLGVSKMCQLILVNKAVNEKEQWQNKAGGGEAIVVRLPVI